MDYKYISYDTFNNVGLHDCEIEDFIIEGNTLRLQFDHIDVLKEHPLNESNIPKSTGKAEIIFENFNIENSFMYDKSKIKGNNQGISVIRPAKFQDIIRGVAVLTINTQRYSDGTYFCKIMGDRNGFFEFWFSFEKSIVCWNKLKKDAWFAHWDKRIR